MSKTLQPARVIWSGAGILILVILATSLLSALYLRRQEIRSWHSELSNLALVLSEEVGQTLSSAQVTADSIADQLSARGIHTDAKLRALARDASMHSFLRERIAVLPQIDVASVVNADGDVLSFSRGFPVPGINIAERDYFQAQRQPGGPRYFISVPVKNKANGLWVFYVSRRIEDHQGRFLGLVLIGLSVDHAIDFFARLGTNLGPGATVTLYRSDFSVMTRWPRVEELIGKRNLTGTTYDVVEVRKLTHGVTETRSPRFSEGGRVISRLGAVRVLERHPMIINVTVSEDLFLANWRRASAWIALSAGTGVLAVWIAAVLILRITRQRERSSELLRDLAEQVPGMLFQMHRALDGTLTFPYVNRQFADVDQADRLDSVATAEQAFAMIHPEDRATVMAAMEASAQDLSTWQCDYRLLLPGGRVVWRSGHALPSKQADGSLTWHGFIADNTDRMKADAALRQSQAKLQATLDAIPDVLFEVDEGACLIDFRSPRSGINLPAVAEFLGKRVYEVMEPAAAEVLMRALSEAGMQGRSDGHELQFRLNGALHWFELTVSRKAALPEESARFIVVARNVTDRKTSEIASQKSLALLKATIDCVNDAILVVNREGRWELYNHRFLEMWRIPDEIVRSGDDAQALVHVVEQLENGEEFVTKVQELYANPDASSFDVVRFKDGRTIERYSLPQRIPDVVQSRVWSFRDITERKSAQDKLMLAASVFTHAREAIMISDVDGDILDVNDAFTTITGYSRDEALGRNPRFLNSGRQEPEFYATLWAQLKTQGHWYGEIWNRRKNGELFAVMETIGVVGDEQGQPKQYVALFSDISVLKAHQQHLEHIALYDPLTGLPNRSLLAERMQRAMVNARRRQEQMGVAYLDLDGFKSINDRHGHAAGDQMLIELSARMQQALREGDTLARLGGDEFVAVLVDLRDTAANVALLNRLLSAAAQPVQLGELRVQLSASLGVTFYPQSDEVDADQLLRQADQAMYQAKLGGKNRYHVFDAEQDRHVRGHMESIERLSRALRHGEFVLYYQPKVNLRSGEVVGAEALIRWLHPTLGVLPPAEIFPLIEGHPLSAEVGDWVIGNALAQMAQWAAAGVEMPVSVNIDAFHLQQPSFVERLVHLLAAHPGVRPGQLELEVLETSALDDVTAVSQVLEACKLIGVHLALDDFGTGYSSLTYLKRLPVSVLKIDQSFVRDMLDDPDDLAILQGVLGLARAFGLRVIAEGLESRQQGTILLQLGCEVAQGYVLARPMPASEFLGWLANWRPDPAWGAVRVLDSSGVALLFAWVEHRSWMRHVEAYLSGERSDPPLLDDQHSQLSPRLDQAAEGDDNVASLEALHQRTHVLATQLCQLKAEGGNASEWGDGLVEFNLLRDTLQRGVNDRLHRAYEP